MKKKCRWIKSNTSLKMIQVKLKNSSIVYLNSLEKKVIVKILKKQPIKKIKHGKER